MADRVEMRLVNAFGHRLMTFDDVCGRRARGKRGKDPNAPTQRADPLRRRVQVKEKFISPLGNEPNSFGRARE